MTDNTTPREAITTAIQNANNNYVTSGAYPMTPKTEWQADAVIAHLWQAADDPEVVEEVAKSITSIWNKPSPNPTSFVASAETLARAASLATLTTLLGPRPAEQEAECG